MKKRLYDFQGYTYKKNYRIIKLFLNNITLSLETVSQIVEIQGRAINHPRERKKYRVQLGDSEQRRWIPRRNFLGGGQGGWVAGIGMVPGKGSERSWRVWKKWSHRDDKSNFRSAAAPREGSLCPLLLFICKARLNYGGRKPPRWPAHCATCWPEASLYHHSWEWIYHLLLFKCISLCAPLCAFLPLLFSLPPPGRPGPGGNFYARPPNSEDEVSLRASDRDETRWFLRARKRTLPGSSFLLHWTMPSTSRLRGYPRSRRLKGISVSSLVICLKIINSNRGFGSLN